MAITYATSQSVREHFERDGYYLAKGVFSSSEVAELEEEFDWIVSRLRSSGENINAKWGGPEMDSLKVEKSVVIHTHNVQRFSAAWAKSLYQQKYLEAATSILGPDIVLHHSKLFQKPSEEGAPFPMHQDWTYFPTVNDSMIAGIIHVSRATDEMGCLRVYPGTHREGRVSGSSGQTQSEFLEKHPLAGATPLEAEPGDVVFFSYFLLHGSMPNRSSETRKTVLVQMYSGKDHVEDGNSHVDEKLVLAGRNHFASRSMAGASN